MDPANTYALLSIAAIVVSSGITIGIMLRGQRAVESSLEDLKEKIEKLDDKKLDREVHVEVVRRLDGDLSRIGQQVAYETVGLKQEVNTIKGEVQTVRHRVNNLEQVRVPPHR